ncbi:MAG: MFS transporter [Akkermansia sp.]
MYALLLTIIYLAFISLGLPDSMLGAAWPVMQLDLGVPLSYAGGISMIIAMGTIVSSLASDWLVSRMGTARVTSFSVLLSALALLGFAGADSYLMLCLLAIPYGLGAGAVDAALNHYVAVNYAARHMNWLHACWGVGVSVSPFIMGFALQQTWGWAGGYLVVGIMQLALALLLLLTLPLWKSARSRAVETKASQGLLVALRVKKLPYALLAFFGYCALESTAGLWASSYLVQIRGVSPITAASYASLFFIGITLGRVVSGLLTLRLTDRQLILVGITLILIGSIIMLIPLPTEHGGLVALLLIGLGCAPVYPSFIHAVPQLFGSQHAPSIIGLQMASAYLGTSLMPPLFGLMAQAWGIHYYPYFLAALALLMLGMMHQLKNKC